jgi:hypothetical protein
MIMTTKRNIALAAPIALMCLGSAAYAAPVAQKSKPKPAPTVTLGASASQVAAGGTVTLNWSSSNSTSCRASGGWTGTKKTGGRETVTVSADSSYSLSCSGLGGTAMATVQVSISNGNAIAGGIWRGTDPSTGGKLIGIVTETGNFAFLRDDGSQYYGTFHTVGNDLAGTYLGALPVGSTYPDGSNYGTGTVSGTVVSRKTISANMSFTTAAGTAVPIGSATFAYDKMYNNGSSLADISGNYTNTADKSIININKDGTIFSQSPSTGCVVNGLVKIIGATYNAYDISYSFSSCTGQFAFLNGTTAVGLGMMDRTTEPRVLRVGLHNDAAHYVISGAYPRK